jgi:hypothetical protein
MSNMVAEALLHTMLLLLLCLLLVLLLLLLLLQGTMSHMAPEALLQGRISKAGDVYAYGITLWELFTGGQAYQGAAVGCFVLAYPGMNYYVGVVFFLCANVHSACLVHVIQDGKQPTCNSTYLNLCQGMSCSVCCVHWFVAYPASLNSPCSPAPSADTGIPRALGWRCSGCYPSVDPAAAAAACRHSSCFSGPQSSSA